MDIGLFMLERGYWWCENIVAGSVNIGGILKGYWTVDIGWWISGCEYLAVHIWLSIFGYPYLAVIIGL